MAWTVSLLQSATFRDSMKNVIALNLSDATAGAYKVALYNNSETPSADTDPATFSTTNEVTGTNWATGGIALTTASPALTLVAGIGVMWDAADVSVASTTVANAYGCKVYSDLLAPKAIVAAIYFGGSAYSTNNGTFGIVWDVNGLFRIDLTP